MASRKATKNRKSSKRAKGLAAGKKMNEVKPLAFQYYISVKGTKQNP